LPIPVVEILSIFLKNCPKFGKILSFSPYPVGYGDLKQPYKLCIREKITNFCDHMAVKKFELGLFMGGI
jgi:hypothetical protein